MANETNEEEIVVNAQIQTIVPLNKPCQSCALYLKKERKRVDVTKGATWKILYSFVLGIITSLIIHHYKGKHSKMRLG